MMATEEIHHPQQATHLDECKEYYRILKDCLVLEKCEIGGTICDDIRKKCAGEVVEVDETKEIEGFKFVHLTHVNGWLREKSIDDELLLEKVLNGGQLKIQEGPFYYKTLKRIEVLVAPDLSSPIVVIGERKMVKEVGQIIEGSKRYTVPGSSITFVQLSYEEGWIYETDNLGEPTLKPITKGPEVVDGRFFYLVSIPVGVRLAPNIMSQRTGVGYKLNTIVEGCQRWTPPGSTITYVKIANQDGWVFETTMDGRKVLDMLPGEPKREVGRSFYRLLVDLPIVAGPSLSSNQLKVRIADSVIECSEAYTPDSSEITFLKLRHDDGWVYLTDSTGKQVLEKIDQEPSVIEGSVFYRVKIAIGVRNAPDIDCNRMPGMAAKDIDSIVECSLRYIPPGSKIVYAKLAHEHGWIFEQTVDGKQVLERLTSEPERKKGKAFYRALQRISVRISPENSSTLLKFLEPKSIFAVEQKLKLPCDGSLTFLKLWHEKGWLCKRAIDGRLVVEPVSESIYNLYINPQSWLAIGYPNKTWHKIPDGQDSAIIAEETLLQRKIFKVKNTLSSSSQGRDSVPLSRSGHLILNDQVVDVTLDVSSTQNHISQNHISQNQIPQKLPSGYSRFLLVDLPLYLDLIQEIKHPASNLLFIFPWKQLWWIFELDGKKHSVEVQHGLRGGFRGIFYDGEPIQQQRPISGIIWDTGSCHEFEREGRKYQVEIALEGAFFSSFIQFFSYSLKIDGNSILQTKSLDIDSKSEDPPQ